MRTFPQVRPLHAIRPAGQLDAGVAASAFGPVLAALAGNPQIAEAMGRGLGQALTAPDSPGTPPRTPEQQANIAALAEAAGRGFAAATAAQALMFGGAGLLAGFTIAWVLRGRK